jgi:microcystin-dependent protein
MAFEGSVIQTIASGVNGILAVENVVYLLADGRSISKTTYPQLYAVISGRYGESGGNFNIPDMRGYYLRGDSLDSGRDPDLASRVLYGPSTTTSGVGTYQPAGGYSHTHTVNGSGPVPQGWEVPTTPFPMETIDDVTNLGAVRTSSGIEIDTMLSPPSSSASGIDIAAGFMNQASYTFYTYIKAT